MKVYKGRQKLSFEQAGQYYSFAYKIGVEHGKFTERERIVGLLQKELSTISNNFDVTFKNNGEYLAEYLIELIRGEQK